MWPIMVHALLGSAGDIKVTRVTPVVGITTGIDVKLAGAAAAAAAGFEPCGSEGGVPSLAPAT